MPHRPLIPRIAIVGAGLAGLTLASRLAPGAAVTVFEKSRGTGGRMTTRRAEPWRFDHGTQFFTARTPDFQQFLEPWLARGTVEEWLGRVVYLEPGKKPRKRLWFEPHYVAAPSMSALCKALAEGLELRLGTEVAPLGPRGAQGWDLHDTTGNTLGTFDTVLCTAPAPQAVRLLDAHLAPGDPLRTVRFRACFALMLGLEGAWEPGWIAGKARDNPVEWIAAQSTRPGRPEGAALVAHASADWSDTHLEDDPAAVQDTLQQQVLELTGLDPSRVKAAALHRWRYALADPDTLAPGHFLRADIGLAATGDWCAGSRIEDTWLAADRLARELLGG